MGSNGSKRIADSVHGTIALTDLEVNVIDTAVFQRLRNIKHLGLAHFVFPGADFSRFPHSLGVCHVAGLFLKTLLEKYPRKLNDEDIKKFRLAALLHDVGHYPFSHAMEQALDKLHGVSSSANLYESDSATGNSENVKVTPQKDKSTGWLKHEHVSMEILKNDVRLREVIQKDGLDPNEIGNIIVRRDPSCFASLISSDLDADRIDYLLRTARHTGLPYGTVDIDYLLSQIRFDETDRLCISRKALKTADHFLLSRYFDNMQVAFHKSVVGFEWILQDVVLHLLNKWSDDGKDYTANGIIAMIRDENWARFDDAFFWHKFRKLFDDCTSTLSSGNIDPSLEVILEKTGSLLRRTPPKLVAEEEILGPRRARNIEEHERKKKALRDRIPAWAEHFGIDEKLWHIWGEPKNLTKIGSLVDVATVLDDATEKRGDLDQTILVYNELDQKAEPVMDVSSSLMSVLSDFALYPLRVYVLFPRNTSAPEAKRKEIEQHIKKEDLPFFEWR